MASETESDSPGAPDDEFDHSGETPDLFGKGPRQHRPVDRGATIGRYVILDTLGIGGMGVVYKAYDPELDRPVALKLWRGDGQEAAAFRNRLVREAQALARLSHPNVIAVHDVGTYNDSVFVAMEFVEGHTLREWLRLEPRSQAAIVDVFLAAGTGLAAAHGAGLVHRDFKPDNVMVGRDGRVRVLDFGLARATAGELENAPAATTATASAATTEATSAGTTEATSAGATEATSAGTTEATSAATTAASSTMTPLIPDPVSSETPTAVTTPSASTVTTASGTLTGMSPSDSTRSPNRLDAPITLRGAVLGTPRYMSPEQHRGETVDERADQFSFCVTLYEALYAALPFAGKNMAALRKNVLAGRVNEPPTGTHVPRWLRTAILRGLLPDRQARYPSMDALLARLRADPSVVRKRRLQWAGVLALVATAGVAWRLVHRAELQTCAGGARKLAGIWDDSRRATLRTAFLGGGKPYAAAVLSTVEHAFDAYAQGWVAMYTDACQATQVRGEQSQELMDLRMACLNDRLTQLKTLSDLDISGDAAVVEHAAQAAQFLPTLEVCADTTALRAPIAPPSKAAAGRVADLRQRLSRANALKLAGKYNEAVTVATAALDDAEKLEYLPSVGEAAYALGMLQWLVGSADASWRSLRHAYAAAVASRHEELQANAAIDLITVIGRNNHYDEADRWVEIAEANTQRVHSDEIVGRFYTMRADLDRIRGRFAAGVANAQHGLELLRRALGPGDPRLGSSYRALAVLLSLVGRNSEALVSAKHCIAISERQLGPDHPVLAEMHNSLGIIYGELGQQEEALAEYQHAVAILVNAGIGSERPELALYYSNIAGRLESMARLDEAETYVRRGLAIELARKPQPLAYNLSYLWETLAAIKIDLKQAREALEAAQQSVSLSERMGIHSAGVYPLYAVAESYRLLRDYDKAVSTFKRALSIGEPSLGVNHSDLAKLHLSLGRIYFDRHDLGESRKELEHALLIREATPGDGVELADVRFRLAQTLFAADPEARTQALTLAEKARDSYAKIKWLLPDVLPEVNEWLTRHR
jgi:serine/threonine protein kinase/tetratricopeptide (TPR) repeat protein